MGLLGGVRQSRTQLLTLIIMFITGCNTGVKESRFNDSGDHETASERYASQHEPSIPGVGRWVGTGYFRDAHKNAGQHKVIYLGHPQFEGFQSWRGRK
jgi:hypothetical protein